MKKFICLYLICFLLVSCAGLIINDKDSSGKKTAKITGRVTLGLLTCFLSEGFFKKYSLAKNLELAEQQTQTSFKNLTSAMRSNASENELATLYLEYQESLRKETEARKEWTDFNSYKPNPIISGNQAGLSQQNQRQLDTIEWEMQMLNIEMNNLRYNPY